MRETFELIDEQYGRNRAYIVKDGGDIFIEVSGYHGGAVVWTTIRVSRAKLVAGLKHLGGVL